jgi:hypothetical protein
VSKKKKQDALQKAQKHISGSKLTKRVQTVGTSLAVRVDSKGRARSSANQYGNMPASAWVKRDSRLALDNAQAKKVNKKVEKYGGSLVGGKGMAVAGYVTVKGPSRMRQPKQGGGKIGGGKHQLAIYAPLAQGGGKKKDPKPPSSSGGGRSGGSSSSRISGGSSSQDRQQQSAYQRAQDHISARTPEGRPPEMQIRPGTAVEDIADYTNRLGVFNANYSGWMQDRAEADRYQSGRLLEQFAMGLPKAPDVMSGQEMISMANQMNNRIKVG